MAGDGGGGGDSATPADQPNVMTTAAAATTTTTITTAPDSHARPAPPEAGGGPGQAVKISALGAPRAPTACAQGAATGNLSAADLLNGTNGASGPTAAGANQFESRVRGARGEDLATGSLPAAPLAQVQSGQWLAQVSSQTQLGVVRQRMSQASDQLGHSLRQLYASASSVTSATAAAVDVPPAYYNIPGIVPYFQGRSAGPPPSYDDVINPYAPPPSYQSLFGQMRAARKTSRGLLDLLRRLLIILVSTLGCSILIAIMILIPFTMIIVGAIYIDSCNIEHIPAFLLMGGLVWAGKNLLHCYAQCRKAEQRDHSDALAAQLYLEEAGSSRNSASSSHSSYSSSSSASSAASSTASSPSRASGSGSSSSAHLAAIQNGVPPAGGGGGGCMAPPGGAAANNSQMEPRVSAAAQSQGLPAPPQRHRRHHRRHHHHHNHHHNHHQQHGQRSRSTRRHELRRRQQLEREQRTGRFKSSVCESLLNCILFGWFIAGCVIVLRNYEPDFENTASARYCHRTVYMYTFWLVTSAIVSLGLFIGCICCLMVSSALAGRQRDLELA